MKKKNAQLWYWFTGISLFLVMMFNCGVGYYSLSLFVTPITQSFGISNGDFAILYVFYGVGSATAAILLHKLISRFHLKSLIIFGGAISTAGYLIFAYSSSFPAMFLGGALIGASTVFAGTAAVQLMIARWFVERRSEITGLVASASGIGTAIGSPIVGWVILNLGWKTACGMIAALIGVFVGIQVVLLLRESPLRAGLQPYGIALTETTANGAPEEHGVSIRTSRKWMQFWLFTFGMIAVAVVYQIISLYQSAILIEYGYPEEMAVICLSVFAIVDMCSKASAGIAADKYGFRVVTLYCAVASASAFVLIRIVHGTAGAVLFSALLGFWPTMCVLYGVTASIALFGKKYLSEYISFSQTVMCCCSLVGMPAVRKLYNAVGNFQGVMNIAICLLAAFFVMMLVMLKPAHLLREQEMKKTEVD